MELSTGNTSMKQLSMVLYHLLRGHRNVPRKRVCETAKQTKEKILQVHMNEDKKKEETMNLRDSETVNSHDG